LRVSSHGEHGSGPGKRRTPLLTAE
jgi:hypothetical protein